MATAELGLQTGDLPSQLVPETHGAQIPDSLLRSKIESRPLSSKPERLSGFRKGVVALAGGAAGFAGVMFPTAAMAGGERMIAIPGAGDTGKTAAEIYCTPEYLASNPQLLAVGDSNVGGEPTSGTKTNIAEAAGSDTAMAIQQPETGEQRVIVNFTDQDGRALSVLLPVCPPDGEQTGNPEVVKDELQQRLDAWNSGEFRTDLKIEDMFSVGGRYSPLSIMNPEILDDEKNLDMAGFLFQGVYLGNEVVKDSEGTERLIVYFGQEGFQRKRYYMGVNFGRFTNENKSPNFSPVPQDRPSATSDKQVSTEKLQEEITGKEGDVFMFMLTAAKFTKTVDPNFKDRANDGIPQKEMAKEFLFEVRDMLKDNTSLDALPDSSVCKEFVINKRITEFQANHVLLSVGMHPLRKS